MLPPTGCSALKRMEVLIIQVRKVDKPSRGDLTSARRSTQHSFIRDYPVTLIGSDWVGAKEWVGHGFN